MHVASRPIPVQVHSFIAVPTRPPLPHVVPRGFIARTFARSLKACQELFFSADLPNDKLERYATRAPFLPFIARWVGVLVAGWLGAAPA